MTEVSRGGFLHFRPGQHPVRPPCAARLPRAARPATAGAQGTSPGPTNSGGPMDFGLEGRSTAMKAALKDPLFWSHETTLKSRRESARGARTFVSQHLLEHHEPALVDNVRSVVSELAGMLIAHDGQES